MRDEGGGMKENRAARRRTLIHPSSLRPHPFLVVLALLVVVGALAFFFVVPAAFERRVNGTRQSPPYAASERARALYQARKLQDTAARSGGRFVVIRTRGDLTQFLERRKSDTQLVAGTLGIEGAHALDGDVSNVDVLFDAGFRTMAPTHFFDNE